MSPTFSSKVDYEVCPVRSELRVQQGTRLRNLEMHSRGIDMSLATSFYASYTNNGR